MRTPLNHRNLLALLAIAVGAGLLALRSPTPAAAPLARPTGAALAAARSTDTPIPNTPTARATEIPAAATPAPPTATSTPIPPTATPTVIPSPTPRAPGTPPRVGLQAGHWKSKELPDELARLRTSSGANAGGFTEAEVNLAVAKRVAALLESRGMQVDLLPATVPPSYDADAFVSIHADGSASASSSGFKLATPWRTSRASQQLLDSLSEEYAAATGLPQDQGVTVNMRGYYAFNYRRHTHAIARTTPAVILEMGFLTSAADRAIMIGQADRVAVGIANGIVRYLNARDPNDGAALLPPEYRTQRPRSPDGVDVYAAPSESARVLKHVDADGRIFIFGERDGWYQGVVRGDFRVVGWVRKDQLAETNDPPPTPPPDSDS